jgi:hypothetical protein
LQKFTVLASGIFPAATRLVCAGDNFHAWAKNRKSAGMLARSKKFTAHKTIVKQGESEFLRFGWMGWHRRC